MWLFFWHCLIDKQSFHRIGINWLLYLCIIQPKYLKNTLSQVYNVNDDIYLFKQIKKGNKQSFDLLFEKYYNNLCNYAFLFFKDAALTEEIVSDVYIRIWQNRKKIEINSSLKSYLYQSTRFAVITHLRKEKKIMVPITAETDNRKEQLVTPETLLIRKEVAENFRNMIKRLPKQAGLAFRLHKVDGLTYKEIAQTLEISIKTVENHMGKALKMMRAMYAEQPSLFDE